MHLSIQFQPLNTSGVEEAISPQSVKDPEIEAVETAGRLPIETAGRLPIETAGRLPEAEWTLGDMCGLAEKLAVIRLLGQMDVSVQFWNDGDDDVLHPNKYRSLITNVISISSLVAPESQPRPFSEYKKRNIFIFGGHRALWMKCV